MIDGLKAAFKESKTGWKFVKVHYCRHYGPCIMRVGPPVEYNASTWEKSHQFNVKDVFRMSNHRLSHFGAFWRGHQDLTEMMRTVYAPLPQKKTYSTARRLAETTGKCQLFKKGYAIEVSAGSARVVDADYADMFAALVNHNDPRHVRAFDNLYATAVQQVYGGEQQPMGQPGTLRFEVLKGMTIPGDPHPQAPSSTIIVRANPKFQGHHYFSDIVIQGVNAQDEEEEWYGHVIAFLRGLGPAGEASSSGEYVFVRYYMIERVDNDTGLPEVRLALEEDDAAWGMVPTEAVLRPCHILDKWGTGQWQLNLDAPI